MDALPLFLLLFVLPLLLLLALPSLLHQTSLLRWLQRKRYQYEVTFSLYMMTPTEKFILNSFLFLTLSMILIAASLYLPEHIMTISHRAFYYYSGSHHSSAAAGLGLTGQGPAEVLNGVGAQA